MLKKIGARLFTIIFLPLMACQFSGVQPTYLIKTPLKFIQQQFFLAHLLFILLIVLLSGCQPIKSQSLQNIKFREGEELAFETIELLDPSIPNSLGEPSTIDKWPDNWDDKNPGLLVITSSQEITSASQYITSKANTTLEKMDFSQFFSLIAFNGWKSSLHSNFKIQKIIKDKDQVYVFAQPSQEGPQLTISSLYHLISIKKIVSGGKDVHSIYILTIESQTHPKYLFISHSPAIHKGNL